MAVALPHIYEYGRVGVGGALQPASAQPPHTLPYHLSPPLHIPRVQDKCEPPVYVSDRRFMKAVKMLQAWHAPVACLPACCLASPALPWLALPLLPARVLASWAGPGPTPSSPRAPPAALPQVAAWADGRSAVHEYDCLLLEFVLGQRPDDAHVSTAPAAAAAPLLFGCLWDASPGPCAWRRRCPPRFR